MEFFLNEHSCQKVFFDVGANIGVQYRKLAEPDKYPSAPILSRFNELFRAPPWCSVCTISFEANPLHTPRLKALQSKMETAKAPPLFVIHAAASDADLGAAKFLLQGHQGDFSRHQRTRRLMLSASLASGGAAYASNLTVPTVDLARVVHVVAAARPRRVYMKLDVEGDEAKILLHLIKTQALCAIDQIDVEWHSNAPHWMDAREPSTQLASNASAKVRRLLQTTLPFPGCKTKLTTLDDETYYRDQKPWPQRPLC